MVIKCRASRGGRGIKCRGMPVVGGGGGWGMFKLQFDWYITIIYLSYTQTEKTISFLLTNKLLLYILLHFHFTFTWLSYFTFAFLIISLTIKSKSLPRWAVAIISSIRSQKVKNFLQRFIPSCVYLYRKRKEVPHMEVQKTRKAALKIQKKRWDLHQQELSYNCTYFLCNSQRKAQSSHPWGNK